MYISYQVVLIGSILLLMSVLATSFFSRIRMPILLIFLILGMLAGEEGPGGIEFKDMQSAHLVGVIALGIILLDAGLKTRAGIFRVGLLPALSLASVGTFITATLIGLFSCWLLNLSLLEGLLIGAILCPTDPAVLFALLRTIKIAPRVSITLEIESGSNDPIAILLTVSIIPLLLQENALSGIEMYKIFFLEIGLGSVIGIIAGYLIIWFNNQLRLTKGLYPLFIFSSAMLVFAATNLLGGSGYLAIYLAGIVIGNGHMRQYRNALRLHDSLAWLSQISMFLMLGLLVTPSALIPHMFDGLCIVTVLVFVARPVAVFISLLPFKFNWREKTFIAWTGLRGAVPIILAINPWLVGLRDSSLYFNLVFFVVIVSIILQGWPVLTLARRLKIAVEE